MQLESLRTFGLSVPFHATFKHASAERVATETLWVEARTRDGVVGYGEGCPRDYVTAENVPGAHAFVAQCTGELARAVHDLASLTNWVARWREAIDRNPAAWSAVEIALLDVLGKTQGRSVEALLGLAELDGRFRYTAVLGDAPDAQFGAQLARYQTAGFRDFKIKLSGEATRDRAKVQALTAAGITPSAVRADANNLWRDADVAIRHLDALAYPFCALEEPLRTGDYVGMREVARALDIHIILDESLLRADQLDHIAGFLDRCIVNLRISKMGGVLRSLELVRTLRSRGGRLIIGAHVGETSVLTRAALTVAGCARDILAGQEGAFGTYLLARDVVEPPIMFDAGGVLDATDRWAAHPGFGLAVSTTGLVLAAP